MRWRVPPELTFLRRRVARRIFVLFVVCAMLPVTGFAALAFVQVSAHLSTQSHQRLRQVSKATAMSIVERLGLLEGHLKVVAAQVAAARPVAAGPDDAGQVSGLLGIAVATETGEHTLRLGWIDGVPPVDAATRRRLHDGRTVVTSHPASSGWARVFLRIPLDTHRAGVRHLVAEVDPAWLWEAGDKNTLPPATELCVLDGAGVALVCTLDAEVRDLAAGLPRSGADQFEWVHRDRTYLASAWSIPMAFRFGVPRWTVVVSEARHDVLAPMTRFTRTFPLVALLSLWIVLLLSIREIRRTLGPIEQLQAATSRVARGDFSARVAVTSGDEFQQLGGAFNGMADRLSKQFGTLTALAALDRAILSSHEAPSIAATVLAQMNGVVPCDEVRVTLVEAGETARTYVGAGGGEVRVIETALAPSDLAALLAHPVDAVVDLGTTAVPRALREGGRPDVRYLLVWPIARHGRLTAVVALGYVDLPRHTDEDRAAVRQVADQLAVALANAAEVAERTRAEQRLQESNRRLEGALADLTATQQQVLQQERLHALGQMASGIAHDFNNTLTPILGYTELLLDSRNLGEDKTRRYLTLMNTAAKDAGNIVRRLREFYRARDQQEPLREVLLNELVEQAIVLTRPRWRDQALAHGAAIRVEKDLREVPMVAVVEAEIRELLTNLIFNAVDAMPQGGSIALRTRPDGERVTLEVADTGTGMSEEVRRRCLEPFFSTKGERGTGLGLAMVYGIVQRHGGTLHIESEPGHGTTFVIQLPASTRGSAGPAAQDGARTRRALSVLLVDDDREAREVLVAYLAADGHTVHAAADGREAWKAFQRGRFDLVIADRVMPHMSGDQLTVAIKQAAPTVPVVLLSGFTEFHGDVAETAHVADAALSKPITLGALRQVVAQCVGDHDLPLTPIPTA